MQDRGTPLRVGQVRAAAAGAAMCGRRARGTGVLGSRGGGSLDTRGAPGRIAKQRVGGRGGICYQTRATAGARKAGRAFTTLTYLSVRNLMSQATSVDGLSR